MLASMANRPSGFAYEVLGNEVVITHHGRRATRLRGAKAQRFMAEVEVGDAQELMARLTGNYKRGNERTAKNHLRHQGG
jgi:short-subunit dehydrogenase involved in D-alanine esterification of teichoic acids